MSFSQLGLSEKVLAAVSAAGYTTPTPIQQQAIPHVLARRDVLGIAQTGTGKTAAFTLPMLTRLEHGRARARMPRTLILEPTRELAAQVQESFEKYGAGQKLNVALVIGGVSFDDQDSKLTRRHYQPITGQAPPGAPPQARHAAPRHPLGRGLGQCDHLLQPQARGRGAAWFARPPRLFRDRAARRQGPAGAHGRARSIPQE